MNEMVYAKLILYNPTPQGIAVHFSGGCWYNFIVRDMVGAVIHKETCPACDPNINGYENTTNVMTVDSGGGRWYSMSWNQLDGLGNHVPVPADYILSWSFKNPDQPIPEASKTITLTDRAVAVRSFLEICLPILAGLRTFGLVCGICWRDSVVPGLQGNKEVR